MSDAARPTISVIIATWNCSATIERCLDSVLAQTYPNIDVVVVDGESTDGTVDILRRYELQLGALHVGPDDGIYDAWNTGLGLAAGRWITFLGADDHLASPDVFERLAPALSEAPDAARVVYGSIRRVDAAGTAVDVVGEPWEALRDRWSRGMVLPHPGLLHRRDIFNDHGSFDTSFRIAGDYELLLRELPARPAMFVPDVIVANVQEGGISTQSGQARRSLDEAQRARELHGQSAGTRTERAIRARHAVSAGIERVGGARLRGTVAHAWRRLAGRSRT